uniref:Uncharacterized protein n=1 Tax=Lepeophtheirus salmonis TaxID=72036 RepID=A0A0K2T1S0_LEPSM
MLRLGHSFWNCARHLLLQSKRFLRIASSTNTNGRVYSYRVGMSEIPGVETDTKIP